MDLASLRQADVPHDGEGPVFAEPWEAEVFALVVELHARGHFSWETWSATLVDEIARAQREGDPDRGDTYYRHWLAALERLVVTQGLAGVAELAATREAWDRAARATPHGHPIVLDGSPRMAVRRN